MLWLDLIAFLLMEAQKKSEVNQCYCTDINWIKSWSVVSIAYVTEGWEMHERVARQWAIALGEASAKMWNLLLLSLNLQ